VIPIPDDEDRSSNMTETHLTHVKIISRWADAEEGPTTWEGEIPLPTDRSRLEAIFRFFNRVEDADADRLATIGYRLPSLSVADKIVLDGRTYEVDAVGFTEVPGDDEVEPFKGGE
jgi:hypothetical protein